MSYGKIALKNSLWNLTGNAGQQLAQFGFFVFMARLLEPKAFGLVAMALISVELLSVAGRLGQVEALMQRRNVNQLLLSTVFWILAAVGVVASIILIACSGVIAQAFGTPELQQVLAGLAVLVALQNLGAVHEARLQRELAYKKLAMRNLTSALCGSALALVLALGGMGVMSLVFQRIATIIIQLGILWSADGWRPSLLIPRPFRDKEAYATLRTGLMLMGGQVLNTINNRGIDLLVGLFLGPTALGYLRIAWRLFDTVIQFAIYPVTTVAQGIFSRVQDDKERLQKTYLKILEVTAMVSFPIFFGLAAVSDPLIPLVFGEQWQPAIPIMQIMSIMAVATLVNVLFSPLMSMTGHASRVLQQNVIQIVLTFTLIGIASQWSIIAVVAAHALRVILMALLNLYVQQRHVGISMWSALRALHPPLLTSILMTAGVLALYRTGVTAGLEPWLQLGVGVACGVCLFGIILLLFYRRHVERLGKDILQMIRKNG